MSEQTINEFQIHQGSFLNARLNKLLEKVDEYSISPFSVDEKTSYLHCKLLMNCLSSIAVTIWGEVSQKEKQMIHVGIEAMEKHNRTPIFKDYSHGGVYKPDIKLEEKTWLEIKSDILEFRLFLSELLEKYGLGISFEKSSKDRMLE